MLNELAYADGIGLFGVVSGLPGGSAGVGLCGSGGVRGGAFAASRKRQHEQQRTDESGKFFHFVLLSILRSSAPPELCRWRVRRGQQKIKAAATICAAAFRRINGGRVSFPFLAAQIAITRKKVIVKAICVCKTDIEHFAPPCFDGVTLPLCGTKVKPFFHICINYHSFGFFMRKFFVIFIIILILNLYAGV